MANQYTLKNNRQHISYATFRESSSYVLREVAEEVMTMLHQDRRTVVKREDHTEVTRKRITK